MSQANISVLESALDEHNEAYSGMSDSCRAILTDLDQDGTPERIVSNAKGDPLSLCDMVLSVWDYEYGERM